MRLLGELHKTEMYEHRCHLSVVTFCYLENLKRQQNESVQKIQTILNLPMCNILLLILVMGYIRVCLGEKKKKKPPASICDR